MVVLQSKEKEHILTENHTTLFTVSQFASLHNINKRTLHYYDELGLFSPSVKKTNGYRYYTYEQSMVLEVVLALRELGMSIEEIQQYMENRSAESLWHVIEGRKKEIDRKIRRLREIKKLLVQKQKQLDLVYVADKKKIDLIQCEEEYLVLSKSITNTTDEEEMVVLLEHIKEQSSHRSLNLNYGCMISVDTLETGNFDDYTCFYTKAEESEEPTKENLFLKSGGTYIRAFCIGDWDKLPDTYRRILTYARQKKLRLRGYAYEVGMNDMAIQNMDEYVTEISILCEKES